MVGDAAILNISRHGSISSLYSWSFARIYLSNLTIQEHIAKEDTALQLRFIATILQHCTNRTYKSAQVKLVNSGRGVQIPVF